MTDRIHSFTVVLDEDIREDDAVAVAKAILLIRGVLGVESNVSDPGQYVAEARVRRDLGDKLWAVLFPKGGA
ncbi:hypothetical protein [Herbaspirillum sp.]|uniref:hypothetical protein n=1 Tax=Herbaspirillum sp. TaxID=1890675 RepID=UPI000C095F63|nr:hypothetical protein [Herbaspirillum sp.]MAF04398.1 hypothetical protein [Herbaspirillum sp.]|tara:strand:- start:38753 stop:38968 length:216 start_codon:yes stop_codon:yes gene_type:complete